MLDDSSANSSENLGRGILFGPLAIEDQFVIGTKKEVDTNLPFAAAPRVKMRRPMVRGVEPEIQALQTASTFPTHASASSNLPEYEYTPDRTLWQSLAIRLCPVVLTPYRRTGEDAPKIAVSRGRRRQYGVESGAAGFPLFRRIA